MKKFWVVQIHDETGGVITVDQLPNFAAVRSQRCIFLATPSPNHFRVFPRTDATEAEIHELKEKGARLG
jgi:hypothetical protein